MKLKKLDIKNFKGIKKNTFEFNGDNVVIRGDNATGKTTVFDSMCWLLFGKDSLDRADFEIKTIQNGTPLHNVNHEVEGEFSNDDGTSFTLRRVYREKYSSPRGGEVKLTGHTTDYFIDEVPVKEKEYKAYINNIINEDVFKLITNPLYFNEQYSWQNRRKLLLEMCGNVDDESVIHSHGELRKLASILNGRTVEEHKKIVAAKKAAINKELDMIPVRIDEAIENKPEIATNKEVLKENIETLNNDIKKLEEEKALLSNGLGAVENQLKIKDIQQKSEARKNEVLSMYRMDKKRLQSEYELSLKEVKSLQEERQKLISQSYDIEQNIKREDEHSKDLQDEFNELNTKQFDGIICPTCGQTYPSDQREVLEQQFNKQKADNLDKLQGLINRAIESKRTYSEEQELLTVKVDSLTNQLTDKENACKASKERFEALQEPDVNSDDEYASLQGELFLLESSSNEDNEEEIERKSAEICTLKAKLDIFEHELNKYKLVDDIDKRIAELERKQEQLANDKNELDEAMFLMDEFIKAKVDMLEQSINKHFKYARFKMFNVLVNGNIDECCETTYKDVPYRSMNNAARINVGLDIINALTNYYKVTAPVFIDNAEAVTEFIDVNSQTIELIVDVTCKTLKIA